MTIYNINIYSIYMMTDIFNTTIYDKMNCIGYYCYATISYIYITALEEYILITVFILYMISILVVA